MGTRGEVAKAFGDVVSSMWKAKEGSVNPTAFRRVVCDHAQQFMGYDQHDRLPNVICTPHIGASTVEAGERVLTEVCGAVLEALRGTIPTDRIVNGKPESSVRLARLRSRSN